MSEAKKPSEYLPAEDEERESTPQRGEEERPSDFQSTPSNSAGPNGENATEKAKTVTKAVGRDTKSAAHIRGIIIGLLCEKMPHATRRTKIAQAVVRALRGRGRFYFHSHLKDFATSMFFDAKRKILTRVQSDSFQAWLSAWLGINRADALFSYVIRGVETAALSGGFTTGVVPENYWASRPGALYLSNGDGAIIKITAAGIVCVDNGKDGVLFPCGKTLAPWKLTSPKDPFEACSILRNPHCADAHGPDLLRIFVYSLPSNPGNKPIMCFVGGVGSGKTRLAKAIAELFGLTFVAQKVEDDGEKDFWAGIHQGGLFTLDNADTKCRWLADAVANASTGGSSRRRKLYTDDETIDLHAHAWLCITTAIPTFANDPGLADRLNVIRMETSDEETSDGELTNEILRARDAGLSHIAEMLRKALADTAPTPTKINARHPDFAAFAVKIGRALGREAESIVALKAAEIDKSSFCLENDPIGVALLTYIRQVRTFTGTAAQLVPSLCQVDSELAKSLSAKRLGKRLVMLWPHLQKAFARATKESDRNHFTIFTFIAANAECAEFQTVFPETLPHT